MTCPNPEQAHADAWKVACHLCGQLDDCDDNTLRLALYDRFNVSFEDFSRLIAALLPLCNTGASPVNGDTYQGFSYRRMWLAKIQDSGDA